MLVLVNINFNWQHYTYSLLLGKQNNCSSLFIINFERMVSNWISLKPIGQKSVYVNIKNSRTY